jgi:serine/threonine-protein kinase
VPQASDWNQSTLVVREQFDDEPSLLEAGTVVGSYRLGKLIGEGSIGRVYLGEHVRLGRKVAIKVLRTELAKNARQVSRFFTEARAVNDIAHDNIVAITDFIEDGDHPACIIMELLEGRTLADELASEGPLSPRVVIDYACQLLDALQAVHAKQIVHRDLKPANIFIVRREGRDPAVKLLDFGIAKLDARRQDPTAAGVIIGTPDYMSPEQTYGMEIDHRADIYALGVIMYEMLTGRTPFVGNNLAEVLTLHRTALPRALSSIRRIPPRLERIVLACLEKQPDDRPSSAAELKDALQQVAGAVQRRPRARRWIGAAAVALALAAALPLLLARSKRAQVDAPPVAIVPLPVIPIPIPIEPPPPEVKAPPEGVVEAVEKVEPEQKRKKERRKRPRKRELKSPTENETMNPF